MKKLLLLVISLTFSIVTLSQQPKNIIIVLANGMGYNHIKSNQLHTGSSSFENFPVKYGVSTYPAYSNVITQKKDVNFFTGGYSVHKIWSDFEYTDSMPTDPASAGTAIATGYKTGLKAVGVDIDSSNLETILERAQLLGKATGIVTDLPISQSAVSSFAAHNVSSDNTTQIFNSLLASGLTYIAGNGNPALNNNGYKYISEFDWNKIVASETVFENGSVAQDIDGDGSADSWTLLQSNKEIANSTDKRILAIPSAFNTLNLSDLATSSLSHLGKNENGFVNIIETGLIDTASRKNNTEELLQALAQLDSTISSINDWVEANSNWDETMLIITGTYETGYITNPVFEKTDKYPDYLMGNIHVTEGSVGETPNMKFMSKNPTKLPTPLFAKGAGSELFSGYIDEYDVVYGSYINNSEIGQVCMQLMPTPSAPKKPKNIILMIGDGMGMAQIQIANYYTGKTQQYQDFPVKLFMSTYPLITTHQEDSEPALSSWRNTYDSRLTWTDKTYIRSGFTCSGASGTAIASGLKTYYYSLGVDHKGNATSSVARYAKSIGKSAGVVTYCGVTGATPSVFFANNLSRDNKPEIFKQLIIESEADVLIGSGHPLYNSEGLLYESEGKKPKYDRAGNQEMWEDLLAGNTTFRSPSNAGWTTVQDINGDGTPDPWTIISDSIDYAKILSGNKELPNRILGFVKTESSPQFNRKGTDKQTVHYDDLIPNVPDLWQMGLVGLKALNQNSEGFFVMIEGDAIDNAGHSNQKGRLIEEMIRFNTTVDSVISWIESNGGWEENLLIITADHETGLVAGEDYGKDSILLNNYQIKDNGIGNMPGFKFYSKSHSNQLVPLFAKGAGAEIFLSYADEHDYIRGKYLNNSEIGQALSTLWEGTACKYVNKRPIVVSDLPDVAVFLNQDTSFTIPDNIIQDDEDTDELVYSVGSRPKWLQFDPETMIFSGLPDRTGSQMVTVKVTDGKTTGAAITTSTMFRLTVTKPTDINELQQKVTAYPNPTTTYLHIATEGSGWYKIIDQNGKTIITKQISLETETIDVSSYSAGVYTLRVFENNTETVQKVIVR